MFKAARECARNNTFKSNKEVDTYCPLGYRNETEQLPACIENIAFERKLETITASWSENFRRPQRKDYYGLYFSMFTTCS